MRSIENLFGYLEAHFPEKVDRKVLNRGDYLLQKGQKERYTYFVETGAIAVKLENEEKSHIIRFGYKGSYFNSLPSFFDNSPSIFDMVALRRSEVKRYSKEAVFELIETKPEFKSAYIRILENLTAQFVEREIDLLTHSPQERYHRVLNRSPRLFEEVPLKYIAEYLRMSPETLSRLRKS